MSPRPSQLVSVRLPPELRTQLKEEADAAGLDLSEVIRERLERGASPSALEPAEILERLEALDATLASFRTVFADGIEAILVALASGGKFTMEDAQKFVASRIRKDE